MTMNRRHFAFAGAALWAGAQSVRAQGSPPRIGILSPAAEQNMEPLLRTTREALQKLGATEGRDYVLDGVHANGRIEDLPAVGAALAARGPAVVISSAPLIALKAVPRVPVVGLSISQQTLATADAEGHAGRLTGVNFMIDEYTVKRLEMLAGLLPAGATVMNLAHPVNRGTARERQVRETGERLKLNVLFHWGSSPEDIAQGFVQARKDGAHGVNQVANQILHTNRSHIIREAAAARLPTMYEWAESAVEGGLIGLGMNRTEMWANVVRQAWHLAQGRPIAEVPLVLASRERLAVNLKTAAALGFSLPDTLVQRAHDVVR